MSIVSNLYILGCDIVTPMGMNSSISLATAKADLGRFSQLISSSGLERFTYSKSDYLVENEYSNRVLEQLNILLENLLNQLPKMLKPIPLLLSLSDEIDVQTIREWIEESKHYRWLSFIEFTHEYGSQLFQSSRRRLDNLDALLVISISSLVKDLDLLINESKVLSNQNPWGIIPSEGGSGVIFVKKNIIEALKLEPLACVNYLAIELNSTDRRGMMRLVRKASEHLQHFGVVYSDMTNSRADTEEYGFAIGARGELFSRPQQVMGINELWGTMGACSALALVTAFITDSSSNNLGALLIYDQNSDRSFLQLERLTVGAKQSLEGSRIL